LSLVLLIAAGLLVRSFVRLSNVPLGFDPHGVYVASVNRPVAGASDARRNAAFAVEALEGIRRLPGAGAVGLATQYPLGTPNAAVMNVDVYGAGTVRLSKPAALTAVGGDYFRVLRIPRKAGRWISDANVAGSQKVAVVNEKLAQEVFGGRGALGQRIRFGGQGTDWIEVTGVVGDTRGIPLGEEPEPAVYVPYAQMPSAQLSFLVRAAAPAELADAVRKAVLSVDRSQPLSASWTMDELVARQTAPLRFRMLLLGLFAALAMTLAAVGVYGVVSYSCSRRAREFGIRAALGAGRREILGLVLRQAGGIAVVGVAVGLAAAFGATRLLAGFLYGTKPDDAATFVFVPAGLLAVALLAGYLPARRAGKLDPARLLREE
jgi:putative ABC transport system permease protein